MTRNIVEQVTVRKSHFLQNNAMKTVSELLNKNNSLVLIIGLLNTSYLAQEGSKRDVAIRYFSNKAAEILADIGFSLEAIEEQVEQVNKIRFVEKMMRASKEKTGMNEISELINIADYVNNDLIPKITINFSNRHR